MSKYFRWLEVKNKTDVYEEAGVNLWGNREVYPLIKEEQTVRKFPMVFCE
jgi:hypothetical protein